MNRHNFFRIGNLKVVAGDGIVVPPESLKRIDGNPILPGTLYIDETGALQLRDDDGIPAGMDWYGAWL